MTYLETIQYLNSFIDYEKKDAFSFKKSLALKRIKVFLALLGNPQDSLRCIHIAGTKGKGSTCAFTAHILREAGFRVGLYTSPHLLDFRERIRVLNPKTSSRDAFEGMIEKSELSSLTEKLKPAIERYNKNSKYGALSFFEVYTVLAFIYFQEKKADFVVLETGLGGRLDATNVVKPYACGITSLSYEHTQILGKTLSKIAAEKAGIIKSSQTIVIAAAQKKEAMKVIRRRCRKVGARLYEINKDLRFEKKSKGFNIKGIFDEYRNLKIKLLGRHQLINATLATGLIESLRLYNIKVGVDSIKRGLYNTIWPGRCEVVSHQPLVILDGAQNLASALALKETIKENFKYKRLILVLGISRDKDIKGICKQLYNLTDKVILTKANNPRATEPRILVRYFKGKTMFKTNTVKEAVTKAKILADKEDLILITGSLFVVGETRSLF